MAARGLVNGRSPLRRSGRDLVFRCYPPELLSPHKKTEADLLGQPLKVMSNEDNYFLVTEILANLLFPDVPPTVKVTEDALPSHLPSA